MVYLHLAEGFEEIEAVTIVDVLRRAGLDIKTVSVTKSKIVKGVHDIKVLADIMYEEADYDKCEMIILPGGIPGANNLAGHEGLIWEIQNFAAKDKWLAAICAAPMVFGDLSLLEGKHATIYPGKEAHLLGAKPSDERVVADGNFITAKGPGTAMDFSVKIVELLKGEKAVNELRKAMIL